MLVMLDKREECLTWPFIIIAVALVTGIIAVLGNKFPVESFNIYFTEIVFDKSEIFDHISWVSGNLSQGGIRDSPK